MAMTFPFRGPIPDWLNPGTAGHPFWRPAETPVQFVGRGLLDGASATYVFAPERLRRDLEVAWEELRPLGVSPVSDHRQALEQIEHIHRNCQDVIAKNTPEYRAFCKWKSALNIIKAWNIYGAFQDGRLSGFGDPDQMGSHPHWIHPLAWMAIDPDPAVQGKFSGHGLVFWNVRVVNTLEVIAVDEARENSLKEAQEAKAKRHPSWDDCERWFISRVQDHAADPRHPTERQDLEAAAEEFKFKVQRKMIRDLRDKHVTADRRRQGPSTS